MHRERETLRGKPSAKCEDRNVVAASRARRGYAAQHVSRRVERDANGQGSENTQERSRKACSSYCERPWRANGKRRVVVAGDG